MLETDSLRCSTTGCAPGAAPGGPALAAPAATCCSSPMRGKSLLEPACGLRPPACKPSIGVGSGAASLFTGSTFIAELAEHVWPCSVSCSRDKARPGDSKAEDVSVGKFDADNAAAASSGPSKVSTSICRSTSKYARSSPSPKRVFRCESLGTLKSLGSERRPCAVENEWGMAQGPLRSCAVGAHQQVRQPSVFDRAPNVQVRRLIVFRGQMFGRIFAISLGVRAHFAPGPCAFARRGATREKIQRATRFFACFI